MVGLYFFGRTIEKKKGRHALADIYALGAISGGIFGFYHNIYRQGFRTLLGASGAVSAIMGNYILNFPNSKIYLHGFLGLPAWMLGIVLLFQSVSKMGGRSQVSHSGHLGGLLVGGAYFLYQKRQAKAGM